MNTLLRARMPGIILALALALALSGCSAIKLGYNNLPNLAYWWLDGYVDFSDDQAPRARQELASLHGWHRQQELPRLVELLARMEQMAGADVTPQQACGMFAELRARLEATAEQAAPAAAALASTLSPSQLVHLQRKFRSNNEKYSKDWIAPPRQEQQDKFFDRMLDRAEAIYGRLDEPQRAALRRGIAGSIHDAPRVLAERQRRQQDLLQVLQRLAEPGLPPQDARALLHGWLQRVQHSPDAAYHAWQEALVQEGCRTFAAVHQSTTSQQRSQAARRLAAYQRDLRELAAQQR
jgi:hypothetical protein